MAAGVFLLLLLFKSPQQSRKGGIVLHYGFHWFSMIRSQKSVCALRMFCFKFTLIMLIGKIVA